MKTKTLEQSWRCTCIIALTVPADVHKNAQIEGLQRGGAILKVTDIKIWERVVDKAVHGAIWTVHILIDQPWNKIGCEGDHECLQNTFVKEFKLYITENMFMINQMKPKNVHINWS